MNNILQKSLGNIDIYLFDQLLKGRFDACKTVMDVGCGNGRNLTYFLQNHFDVYGIDASANAIEEVRKLSQQIIPAYTPDHFQLAHADFIPFKDAFFDLVICNAVLHFAKDPEHFDAMLHSIWRILKPGGYLFVRLASDIGIENLVRAIGNGRYLLPDGSERFLVNEALLLQYTHALNGELFEFIKTTNVQNLRCMTTWCIQKK
ncbi:MAG: class I SAM-dependent methyltransferase [Cytophagales bacterium]|nr:class I SAM-dependent methyltransferase [Cytophaga sp.]